MQVVTRRSRVRSAFRSSFGPALLAAAALAGVGAGPGPDQPGVSRASEPATPVVVRGAFAFESSAGQGSVVAWDEAAWLAAPDSGPFVAAGFPISATESVDLELERFWITGPTTRIVVGSRGGPDRELDFDASLVRMYRGSVRGVPGSHVYLSSSPWGGAGQIDLGPGRGRLGVYSRGVAGADLEPGRLLVAPPSAIPDPSNGGCRVVLPDRPVVTGSSGGGGGPDMAPMRGQQHLQLAVETDYEYFELFGDLAAAGAYAVQVYGAVSDIYIRDVNTRMELVFLRLWDDPADLFNDPEPLNPFRDYWNANMGAVVRDTAQFFTGRRDLSAGGVAYVSSLCGTNAYSWSGYTLGFYDTIDGPSAFTRDVVVTAHELGHNCGTLHDHDYGLDDCQTTLGHASRGGIMSYCGQTISGGNANIDLRFPTLQQEIMRDVIVSKACVADDCNANGKGDANDIATGVSQDTNANGIPDECEDCNANGRLDPADIALGVSTDLNGNGVPDDCEPDCNGNGVPDDRDILLGADTDAYLDGVPDACEADCNNNGISDYTEIRLDMTRDKDRDAVLDACQDCDNDGTPDLVELGGAGSVWVANTSDSQIIQQFHPVSGVPMAESAPGKVRAGHDLICTADGRILVSSHDDNRVVEFDGTGAYVRDLVAAGAGGLSGPNGLLIGPDGALYVASEGTSSVLRYDAATGAFLGAFVAAGSGGLSAPFGLVFTAGGNLLVNGGTGSVREYAAGTGAFVRVLVASGSGGLNTPRGMLIKPDGGLLVCSMATNKVLEYNGATGAFVGQWSKGGTSDRLTLDEPWGIRLGHDGDVYVGRAHLTEGGGGTGELHLTEARIYQFDIRNGNFVRAYVEGHDFELDHAAGFDFMPGLGLDDNFDQVPDACQCYADCDRSTGAGTLDFFDFICFQDRFGVGDPYSCDCDQSTGAGVCDFFDFICFQDAFALGCP